ncbi:FAD:protein FMN transferase [Pelagicoccus mobilis]|uniref:FAD:protein FMN transferase n=1 Tax=Pelagicoccus mobilis TaxID=415221 RepID=A0A934VT75_9BACT|nr:FAD:protein FMN transferase [Pelagicoccus mobilis]MBK1879229.1 FAD:protein FMN transferase [Pelagicoccus mobilis]
MLKIEEKEGLFAFRHEAMATELTLSLGGVDQEYAKGISYAFFERVDEIESKLSLYQETSDVTRINLLKKGEQTRVSEECIDCLQLAMTASELTSGRFHPFLGVDALKVKGKAPAYLRSVFQAPVGDPSSPAIQIDPNTRQLVKVAEGVILDFGGIGKGYALDVAMEEIEDWDVPVAMANFGGSTLLFKSEDEDSPWSATLDGEGFVPFRNGAFSSSGVGFQGEHIVSSVGETLLWERSYARTYSAALADALTTGAMLMGQEELDTLCQAQPQLVVAASQGGKLWGGERFRKWGG